MGLRNAILPNYDYTFDELETHISEHRDEYGFTIIGASEFMLRFIK